MSQSQFGLLTTRRFLPLFVTQFLAAFNDNVFKNALVIMMTYRAGEKLGIDERFLVTAAAGIFILPFFLFSATAGQLADKHEKSRMIRIIRFAEIPVMILAAIGFFMEDYWMLMAVLFGAGTLAAFFGPLKYSILPEHLKADEIIGGNAWVEAGTFIAILLGTIVGGILILRDGGVAAVSAIIVLTAAASWISGCRVPAATSGAPGLAVRYNFLAETWRIVRHAAGNRDVFFSIAGISWFWLLGFTFLAQFPVYARGILHANEEVVTLFLTVFSVGIALGSLVCNRLLKGQISGAYVPLGAFGMTAGIFLFWLASLAAAPADPAGLTGFAGFIAAPAGWAVLLSLLCVSGFGGIYIVPLYAIVQTRSDPAHRSRAIAANNIMNSFFMVMGAVLTVVLLKLSLSVTEIFLVIGILNIPVALLMQRMARVHIKSIRT